MLALTRNTGESIVILTEHGEVEITYLGMRSGEAKLGVTAPKLIPVLRGELLEINAKESSGEK